MINMGKHVMDFEAHVISKVSKCSQHIVHEVCIIFCLVIAKEVIHHQNKSFLSFKLDTSRVKIRVLETARLFFLIPVKSIAQK